MRTNSFKLAAEYCDECGEVRDGLQIMPHKCRNVCKGCKKILEGAKNVDLRHEEYSKQLRKSMGIRG